MQQTRSSRVHRRDIMNNAPKTLIRFTTPSPDNARAPGAKASSTRKPRARRKFAASRATHSENAAHNPYSRGGIRNMLLPPFNCSSVEQGIAIDKDQYHDGKRFPRRSGDGGVLSSIWLGFVHLCSRLPASSWAIRSNNCFAAGSPGSAGFSLAFASFEVMGIHCGALYFFFRRSWEFGAA